MRVLTVSNCQASEHLGSGYVVSGFVRGLRELGAEVDFLGPDEFESARWLRPRATSYRQALGMRGGVKRALRDKRYDVVEFYGGEAWLASRWLSSFGRERPLLIQHTNGPEPRYQPKHREYERRRFFQFDQSRLMRAAFTSADGVVTVSDYDAKWVVAEGLRGAERVASVEPGLPESFLGRAPATRDRRRLGYCGSWIAKKGVDILSRDCGRVLKEIPDSSLTLVGVGEAFRVADWFPAAACDRIEVFPFVKDKLQLRAIYDRIGIFVLPSRAESFGLVAAEAMASGCAVVTPPIGFSAGLQNDSEVLWINTENPGSLYEGVNRLMRDRELCERVATGGWQRVQGLRWSTAAQKVLATYQRWSEEMSAAGGAAAS